MASTAAPGSFRATPSILETSAAEFAALDEDARKVAGVTCAARFQVAVQSMVARRYEDAEFRARQFCGAVRAVRQHQSESTALASIALDGFAMASRSAIEMAAADEDGFELAQRVDTREPASGANPVTQPGQFRDDDYADNFVKEEARAASHWLPEMRAMTNRFQCEALAFEDGRLASESFMAGDEFLVEEVLRRVRSRASLQGPANNLTALEMILASPSSGRVAPRSSEAWRG